MRRSNSKSSISRCSKDISESGMTYEMTIFFRQFWIDPRLAWAEVANENNETIQYKRADDQYNVAADMIDLLWKPDTYFIDEIGKLQSNCRVTRQILQLIFYFRLSTTQYHDKKCFPGNSPKWIYSLVRAIIFEIKVSYAFEVLSIRSSNLSNQN